MSLVQRSFVVFLWEISSDFLEISMIIKIDNDHWQNDCATTHKKTFSCSHFVSSVMRSHSAA